MSTIGEKVVKALEDFTAQLEGVKRETVCEVRIIVPSMREALALGKEAKDRFCGLATIRTRRLGR